VGSEANPNADGGMRMVEKRGGTRSARNGNTNVRRAGDGSLGNYLADEEQQARHGLRPKIELRFASSGIGHRRDGTTETPVTCRGYYPTLSA
jgi:hypothetical protein